MQVITLVEILEEVGVMEKGIIQAIKLSNLPVQEVVIIKQVGGHLLPANIFVRCS